MPIRRLTAENVIKKKRDAHTFKSRWKNWQKKMCL